MGVGIRPEEGVPLRGGEEGRWEEPLDSLSVCVCVRER